MFLLEAKINCCANHGTKKKILMNNLHEDVDEVGESVSVVVAIEYYSTTTYTKMSTILTKNISSYQFYLYI